LFIVVGVFIFVVVVDRYNVFVVFVVVVVVVVDRYNNNANN